MGGVNLGLGAALLGVKNSGMVEVWRGYRYCGQVDKSIKFIIDTAMKFILFKLYNDTL